MIDTIELIIQLKNKDDRDEMFVTLNNGLRNHNKTKMLHGREMKNQAKGADRHKYYYETSAFYEYGILSLGIEDIIDYGGYSHYSLKAVYKPSVIIYPGDPYAVCEGGDYEQACAGFNAFIDKLNATCQPKIFPYIDGWSLNRIDYCFQMITKYYNEYLHVIKRGDYHKYDKVKLHDSSVHAVGKQVNLNFYDKTHFLMEKGMVDEDTGFHWIRFEFQCNNKYLRSKKPLDGNNPRQLLDFWDSKLAYRMMFSKWMEIIGSGDFYSVPEAVGLLKEAMVRKNRVSELKSLLDFSCKRNIAKNKLSKIYALNNPEFEKKYIENKLIRTLNRVGINELPLQQEWRIPFLHNPVLQLFQLGGYSV